MLLTSLNTIALFWLLQQEDRFVFNGYMNSCSRLKLQKRHISKQQFGLVAPHVSYIPPKKQNKAREVRPVHLNFD